MPDYNFSGLSTRSFEKLIQSIAGSVLGLGTITFGDGPDGGREATFEGRMDYPSKSDPWDGYCVIQAKFLQRAKDSSHDGAWALLQLEEELKAFAEAGKRRRVPEYYIFATNVVLTPVQKKGSKDKALALFKKYKAKVPLKGWALWDLDELGKFLDTFDGIRRAYGAWITPGDVLAELLQQLSPSLSENFLNAITSLLAKELRNDQYANLEQAGHTAEERIPLGHVFVDLPVSMQRLAEPPDEADGSARASELVALLIDRAKDALDPASQSRGQAVGVKARGMEGPQLGRYVLVGGPGQGKTTVGQFACQLFRAVLLKDRQAHLLAPEVQETLNSLLEQCRRGNVILPTARRFPIRVVLSDYAAALNDEPTLSLLAYLARQVVRKTNQQVRVEDLVTWLAQYPWFLVLDGLDEVPPSTNREEVLRKVEEFWIDASLINADVLVLATTRPQGYSDDFSPKFYYHFWLAPLSNKRALHYAARLVEVRYAGEPDRRQKILGRLENALKQESTARLMRSPLQVTIMATLVDQIGTPPQDRWRLFHDYYEVIYNRERERPIRAAELLREHKQNIDAIHHQVGLVLQVESEKVGGTESKLPTDRFAQLVTARLQDEGYNGSDLHSLRERIIDAAANRLVFLVGLESGQVGFEIRSLQEYMAAEALMTGSQSKVQERLRRFAPIANWRNVFLFAAGRCFVRDQHMRDAIHTICVELNDNLAGPVGRTTLAGSLLALEMLEDGVSRHQPRYARLLARCAVRALELPPSDVHLRLADVSEGESEVVLREELVRALSAGGLASRSAWTTILALIGRGWEWAIKLAAEFWPTDDPRQQLEILSGPSSGRAEEWVCEHIEVLLRNPPTTGTPRGALRRSGAKLFKLLDFHWQFDATDLDIPVFGSGGHIGRASLISLEMARTMAQGIKLPRTNEPVHPGWLPYLEWVRFHRNPSAKSLAGALHRIQRNGSIKADLLLISWVFDSCLNAVATPDDLGALAKRVASGALGDYEDWVAAEKRWLAEGVSREDLAHAAGEKPFDGNIALRGFPIASAMLNFDPQQIDEVYEFVVSLKEVPDVQKRLATSFIFAMGRQESQIARPTAPEIFLSVIRNVDFFPVAPLGLIEDWAKDDRRWIYVLDEIGRYKVLLRSWGLGQARSSDLKSLYLESRNVGLLRLLIATKRIDPHSLPEVRVEKISEPKLQSVVIALELGRGDLSTERARELAVQTNSLLVLQDILEYLRNQDWLNEAASMYLLELLMQPAFADLEGQRLIIPELNICLSKRSSEVATRPAWHSLDLPARLLDLIAD